MGSLAQLAKSAGHKVSGCDANVYPPMSTQLQQAGIELIEGFDPAQLNPAPDLIVVGNALSRGNPCIEYMLDQKLPYISGPQWLGDNILKDKHVISVSGTHGKTSTSSMLAKILDSAGYHPGYLIGGVPQDFGISARLGGTAPDGKQYFVIEADEYDTAFFDKRSKFVHYHPRTLVVNNLEYDHADIFDDLAAIQKQFHHVIRTVPAEGLIISPPDEAAIEQTIEMGCWTTRQTVGIEQGDLQASISKSDGSEFSVHYQGEHQADVIWSMLGEHNVNNALAAMAAARHVGVTFQYAGEALAEFKGIKRRMELVGEVDNIRLYDDFAHHPTAITTTVNGLRANIGERRLIAILEPRSNTMKMGVHKDSLGASLQEADQILLFEQGEMDWSLSSIAEQLGEKASVYQSIDDIVEVVSQQAQSGDEILVMSNGGFGGIHQRILTALTQR